MKIFYIAIFSLIYLVTSLDNGVGLTPPMGWNSWNKFGCSINEKLIMSTIDTIVSSGLAKAGYTYVNLDDCWQKTRDENGKIQPNPDFFPNGMKVLADYAHEKGFKFGLYSDAGYATCCNLPGSLGYEDIDAKTYEEWGIDYLKYDNCNTDGSAPEVRYPVMRDALLKINRTIYYSMCEWGINAPAKWGKEVANSWRNTGDIEDNWKSMLTIIDANDYWGDYAGPGGWNDPDMLEVGNGGMTYEEYKVHFGLWCLSKAPLLIGCDITNMSEETFEILTNEEVIAINQDSLGVQGKKLESNDGKEIWGGPLSKNAFVVMLLNRGESPSEIEVNFEKVGIKKGEYIVRDLWEKKDLGIFSESFKENVNPHSGILVKISPK